MNHIDIKLVRNTIKSQKFHKYENLGSSVEKSSMLKAKNILNEGWIRSNYPAINILREIPWEESNKTSRSWSFHIHCWDMLHDLLIAFSHTNDRNFFDPALSVALDWIARYPTQQTESAFAWYDMAVGLRVQRLAFIFDAATRQDDIPDKQVKKMFDSLILHKQYLAEDKNIAFHNNHGFFQVAGQLAMAKRLSALPGMDQQSKQGHERLKKMLSQQFTGEGIHREHSPEYHRMVYETLKGLLDAGLIENQEIISFARKIENNLAWFVLPNGYMANFGDSDYRNMGRGKIYAEKWVTPAMKFVASNGEVGSPPATNMAVFKESGYFIIRHPWPQGNENFGQESYLAQTLCFHSRTHKHADDLSFIWYERGNEILVDAGRYGYLQQTDPKSELRKQGYWYADPNRMYVEDTHAHNTVEVDAKSNPRVGITPYGSALQRWGKTDQGIYFSEARVQLHKSVRHDRMLVYNPGQWLLVFDWLGNARWGRHDYSQWFHFAPTLSPVAANNQLTVEIPGSETPLQVASLLPGPELSDIIAGQVKPRLQGWWSPKDRAMIPNPAVAYEIKNKSITAFATMFCFGSDLIPEFSSSSVDKAGRNVYLTWISDGQTHKLNILRYKSGEVFITCKND